MGLDVVAIRKVLGACVVGTVVFAVTVEAALCVADLSNSSAFLVGVGAVCVLGALSSAGLFTVVGTVSVGVGVGSGVGLAAVVVAVDVIVAPPVFCTIPVRGSRVVEGSDDDVPTVVGDVVEMVLTDGEGTPEGWPDLLSSSVGVLVVGSGGAPGSAGPANATPGVAIARPSPNATAKAPIRQLT